MSDPEHEHHQFVVMDVVNDSVVAYANAELAVTTLQLDATCGSRFISEHSDSSEQAAGSRSVELSNGLRR